MVTRIDHKRMAEYLQNLKRLEALLCSSAENVSVNYEELAGAIKAILPNSSDLGGDVEIAFRTALNSMINEANPKAGFSSESPAIRLIKFAMGFALACYELGTGLPKVPYLLIEDLLESQTIQQAKSIWKIVETWADQLTQEQLFSKGKFTMLKTCNSLLRKLSKSCDTEFCGRILLFLATIYPISERSALNVMGKVNVANVTYYEEKEAFEQNLGLAPHAAATSAEGIAVQHAKNGEEDGEEVEIKGLPTYDLYSKFWKLQSYFAAEYKTFDEHKDYWADFMQHARLVIDTLERVDLNDQTATSTTSAGTTDDTMALDDAKSEDYSGCKFLTSSQLFVLQCRDPMLRQQVSVQLLYFVHYFKVKALVAVEGDKKNDYLKDITFIETKAHQLINNPPTAHSKDLLQTVQRILEREEHWIRWKAASCQAFERNPVQVPDGSAGAKRKMSEMDGVLESKAVKTVALQKPVTIPALNPCKYTFDCSDAHVKEVAHRLVAAMPDFEAQIQQYLDADDPENGIEDEYHPKNDQLYCWRTRRLLAEQSLDVFKVMADGNLGKGLRKLKNLPEPAPRVRNMDDDMIDDDMGTRDESTYVSSTIDFASEDVFQEIADGMKDDGELSMDGDGSGMPTPADAGMDLDDACRPDSRGVCEDGEVEGDAT